MTQPSTPQGKAPRQGRGRGRGRGPGRNDGRGRSGGGRGRGRGRRGKHRGNTKSNQESESHLSDEDIMIAFMHHLRSDDEEAKQIHLTFGSDPRFFVEKAREFLIHKKGVTPDNKEQIRDVQFRSKQNEKSEATPKPVADILGTSGGVFTTSKSEIDQNDHKMEEMVANLTIGNNTHIHHSPQPIPSAMQHFSSAPSIPVRPPPGMLSMGMTDNYPPTPPPTPSSPPLREEETSSINSTKGPPPGLPIIHRVAVNAHNAPPAMPSPHVPKPAKPMTTNNPPATPMNSEVPATPIQTTAAPPKWQPKRLNTRLQEQPGRILANNLPATLDGTHLTLRPREELVATWQLPLGYLRERTLQKLAKAKAGSTSSKTTPESLTIRDALRSLTVGLFRRGCIENGSNSSIISKEVVPADVTQKEYHFEINHQNNTIWGTVPFFTPRTPGNVVLRLYFEDDAILTLATSRCISIVVSSKDLEQTLRFILSNFKSKRGSTNFSSIHSLAAVLGQHSPASTSGGNYHNNNHSQMDGAGRAAWGGICESRKIVDVCRQDYLKKKAKVEKQIDNLDRRKEELDARTEADDDEKTETNTLNSESEPIENEELKDWREKMNQAMGERASNERKWREIQMAFASVLRSAINNPHSPSLLKPDIIKKLELEYYLWCPLCENFASNPFEEEHGDGTRTIKYPYPIHKKYFRACMDSRAKMQEETLGFVVKNASLSSNLFEAGVGSSLSEAMVTFYKSEYGDHSASSYRKKSIVRELAESAVSKCDAFPQGTKVVVFGSSANGFGSPKSDLDMCLQLPQFATFTAEEGAAAMGTLAEILITSGMLKVDTARLTARIPVIQFDCRVEIDGTESIIECDISMQNPLACVNTSLLKTYSIITPSVRIIAAIVKRWAKRRNINDPSQHTLSSYGYIIMLLHFLTTHKANKNGQIESIFHKNNSQCPLLPNLQWIDQRILQSPPGSPYIEYQQKPASQYTTMKHPTETSYVVNTHFLRINDQKLLHLLTNRMDHCSAPAPSIGYLLASFFRYYAFEFDYKKHIVSLQAISRSGLSEREAKAESDGWKLYGQSLCIEDPFEEFYDVAHVLKPVNFQRTRREFALAYSKMQSSISEGADQLDGEKVLDLICEENAADFNTN